MAVSEDPRVLAMLATKANPDATLKELSEAVYVCRDLIRENYDEWLVADVWRAQLAELWPRYDAACQFLLDVHAAASDGSMLEAMWDLPPAEPDQR